MANQMVSLVLTKKQALVYKIIIEYKDKFNGNAPSLRTIAGIAKERGVSMSDQTARECIKAMPELVQRGEGGLEIVYSTWSMADERPHIVVE